MECWEIVKILVSSGIVFKGKKCLIELWGQPPKPKSKATGSFYTPTKTPPKRQNTTWNAPQTPSERDIRFFKCRTGGHMQYQCPQLGMEQYDRCGVRGRLGEDYITTQRRLALGMRGGVAQRNNNPPRMEIGRQRAPKQWNGRPHQQGGLSERVQGQSKCAHILTVVLREEITHCFYKRTMEECWN